MIRRDQQQLVVCTPFEKFREAGRVFGHDCQWEIVVDSADRENVFDASNGISVVTSSLPVDHTVLLALNHIQDGKDVGLMFTDGHSVLVRSGTGTNPAADNGLEEIVADMSELSYPEVFSYIFNRGSGVRLLTE